MKIEKDAEWDRLEGRVGQLQDSLNKAKDALANHAQQVIMKQLGLIVGESIVEYAGSRFLVTRVDVSEYNPWLYGRKFKNDGTPSQTVRVIYHGWRKVN